VIFLDDEVLLVVPLERDVVLTSGLTDDVDEDLEVVLLVLLALVVLSLEVEVVE
jgi:hypothetical protein